jgi:hypothetical protein
MNIKPEKNEKVEINISEWNDDVKAYLKPLNGFERLELNDFFVTFYNKENDPEERFDAGFRAALLSLVDGDDRALLAESDREAVRSGSFVPFSRLFNVVLSQYGDGSNNGVETLKKS